MTELASIVAELAKTTENYAVFESAEVGGSQDLTGMYVSLAAFGEEPEAFIEVEVGEEGPVTLTKNKDTASFGNYESESGAVSGIYISHDVLESEESEEGDRVAPDTLGISISPATEEDFEQSQQSEELEDEADALLGDAGTDGVDAEETEETTVEDEAEELLNEAEDAA